ISAGSLTPRALSTPDDVSTVVAPVSAIAADTLAGVRPPARIHGPGAFQPRSSDQLNDTALPPGRVAAGGGLASSSSASAEPMVVGRSLAWLMPIGRHTGFPKRARKSVRSIRSP